MTVQKFLDSLPTKVVARSIFDLAENCNDPEFVARYDPMYLQSDEPVTREMIANARKALDVVEGVLFE